MGKELLYSPSGNGYNWYIWIVPTDEEFKGKQRRKIVPLHSHTRAFSPGITSTFHIFLTACHLTAQSYCAVPQITNAACYLNDLSKQIPGYTYWISRKQTCRHFFKCHRTTLKTTDLHVPCTPDFQVLRHRTVHWTTRVGLSTTAWVCGERGAAPRPSAAVTPHHRPLTSPEAGAEAPGLTPRVYKRLWGHVPHCAAWE